MSRVPCPVDGCDRPARSGYMCGGCEAELRRALDTVPDLMADLDVTLSRQTSRMVSGSRASETPMPFDARASEAGWVLRNTLVGWVRQLQEGVESREGPVCAECGHGSCRMLPWSRGPADTCESMAAWLSAGLQRLVRHPAAEEAHGEITDAVRAAQRATDRPADRQFAGRCPGCGEALYAKPGAATVRCRECDADPVDVDAQREEMLAGIADQLMTAVQVADVLTRLAAPLKAELVRQWGSRGRLVAHGHDPAGHPLYRVSDVRELLVEKLAREAQAKAKRDTKERERMSA